MDYKAKRKQLKLTLEDISKYSKTSIQNVYQFENGEHKSEVVEDAYNHLEDIFYEKYNLDNLKR